MEQETCAPYRTGVRIQTEAEAALPRLIALPFERLLAEDRQRHERERRAPRWWLIQVDRHEVPAAFQRTEDLAPNPQAWLRSLLWLHTVASGIQFLRQIGWERLNRTDLAILFGPQLLLGLGCLLAMGNVRTTLLEQRKMDRSAAQRFAWWRACKFVLIAPLGAVLCLKELFAWVLWRHGGKRWEISAWEAKLAIRVSFEAFEAEVIKTAQRELENLFQEVHRRREASRTLDENASAAGQQARDLTTGPPDLVEHFRELEAAHRQRAHALEASAERLNMLRTAVVEQTQRLEKLSVGYRAFQESLLTLSDAPAPSYETFLDPGRELSLRATLKEAYLDLRAALAEAEAFRSAPEEAVIVPASVGVANEPQADLAVTRRVRR